MPSAFQHRILLIVPQASVVAVVAWLKTNVGPDAVPADLGPALNPSGNPNDPVTHRWCSGAWVPQDAWGIISRLCQLAGLTPPTLATWLTWSPREKMDYVLSVHDGVLANYGVWMGLTDNGGEWGSPDAALAAMGLKRV